jgi:hypothetical protein
MSTETRRKAEQIIGQSRVLGKMYERAVQEEDLDELLQARHQMMAAVQQADRILADGVVQNIERRLANSR